MKIAMTIADLGGCGYYRQLLPGLELRKRGHDVTFHRHTQSPDIRNADVVIAQRIAEPHLVSYLTALRAQNPKMRILHELDDNVHEIPTSNPCSSLYGNDKPATKAGEAMCRMADGMIVSTPDLAERYAKFNANISVARNCIANDDMERFADIQIDGFTKRLGQIRIGWAGSNTHRADLALVVKPLSKILRADDRVRLVFIGDDVRGLFPRELWERIEYVAPSVYEDRIENVTDATQAQANLTRFYDTLRASDFDIAIAPIEQTTFNRCKSHIKLLEYGLAGIPTVASRFGPYKEYAESGGHILTTYNEAHDWERAVRQLVNDRSFAASMARSNRERIAAKHLISHGVSAWEQSLETPASVAA